MDRPVERLEYPEGWSVEIHSDDDPGNPFTECDGMPLIIMHKKAEGHFGWATDEDLCKLLDDTLDRARYIGQCATTHKGKRMAYVLQTFMRRATIYHDVAALIPFSAIEHSGVAVYLGSHDHPHDPGGWDSGWVGFVLVTKTQWREWQGLGPDDPIDADRVRESIVESFKGFAAYVSGDCYGYVVNDPEGNEVESCWGYYGWDSWHDGGYMLENFESIVEFERNNRHLQTQALYKGLVGKK